MNIKELVENINLVSIPVYQTYFNVKIIAESTDTRFKVILCQMEDGTYQDFFFKESENIYKPISEYNDTFGEWWIEEDLHELLEKDIFKDFVNVKVNFKF